MDFRELIVDTPDFSRSGVRFRNIGPLVEHPEGAQTALVRCSLAVEGLAEEAGVKIDALGTFVSQGFWLAPAVAGATGSTWFSIGATNVWPDSITQSYEKTNGHGQGQLSLSVGAVSRGQNVVLIADVLATGNRLVAGIKLVESRGAKVIAAIVLAEIKELAGWKKVTQCPVISLFRC